MPAPNEPDIIRLMIVSLGGTVAPVIKSLEQYKPESIIFLVSHDSAVEASKILDSLEWKPEKQFEIVDDPNQLIECYRKASNCMMRAEKSGFDPDHILIDYTGGTKVMSSSLLMAGAGKPYRFSYVGGSRRSKNGLGVVQSGYERLYNEANPWIAFAEEERRQVATLFNRGRFFAVTEMADELLEKQLPYEILKYFKFVRLVAFGLLRWDQFEHAKAKDLIKKGLVQLGEYLSVYPSEPLGHFHDQLIEAVDRLESIIEKTNSLKVADVVLISDLLNNARRKMADKRNDDAAARIYRALELYGQICFNEKYGCGNSQVRPEMIPESLRTEFSRKYKDRNTGKLKLPLQATFQLLKESGHPAGIRFFKHIKKIKNIQSNRNMSILAHGLAPVSDSAVSSIFSTVSEFVQFGEQYDFPHLP